LANKIENINYNWWQWIFGRSLIGYVKKNSLLKWKIKIKNLKTKIKDFVANEKGYIKISKFYE
jgi:hypothetical protein